MKKIDRDIAAFREAHEIILHQLIPHAGAYLMAAQEGDPDVCDYALDRMAALVLKTLGAVPEVEPVRSGNVVPLQG